MIDRFASLHRDGGRGQHQIGGCMRIVGILPNGGSQLFHGRSGLLQARCLRFGAGRQIEHAIGDFTGAGIDQGGRLRDLADQKLDVDLQNLQRLHDFGYLVLTGRRDLSGQIAGAHLLDVCRGIFQRSDDAAVNYNSERRCKDHAEHCYRDRAAGKVGVGAAPQSPGEHRIERRQYKKRTERRRQLGADRKVFDTPQKTEWGPRHRVAFANDKPAIAGLDRAIRIVSCLDCGPRRLASDRRIADHLMVLDQRRKIGFDPIVIAVLATVLDQPGPCFPAF